ncbi:MAG: flagellar hook-associated protein FlgK [Halothiobacillaceae bacterium]|nr:MAG: flagellar hook-associated protein FlgK [Halothiobacillaceae bacterium]
MTGARGAKVISVPADHVQKPLARSIQMADFLSTSVSGLNSVQRALDVLSHNISNAYTEGYSRQTVTLSTRVPQQTGQGSIGSGTALTDVSRAFDQFLNGTLQTALTEQGRLQQRDSVLGQMEDILGDGSNGLSRWMTDFFNAAQDVANNPSDVAVRTSFLGMASSLADQVNTLDRRFAELEQGIDRQASRTGSEINEMTGELSKLNATIVDLRHTFPDHEPNDLLDRRDLLLRNLSEKVDIKTFNDGEGNVNVTLGNGEWLVLADRQNPIVVAPTATGTKVLVQNKGQSKDITSQVTGGELGGLLRAKTEVLDPLRAELGRVVLSFADAFNTQHALGDDLDGNQGSASFFTVDGLSPSFVGQPKVEPAASGVTMSITNIDELSASDFSLKYVSNQWNLYKVGDDTPIMSGVSGSVAVPGEGITIDLSSLPDPPAAHEPREIVIRPMAGVMRDFTMGVTDPRAVAAATDGAGPGDNGNMLALSGIGSQQDVVHGDSSLNNAFANLMAGFGSEARGTRVSLDAQSLLVTQTQDRRESSVGVNLDEEAANLVRLQNHYMALSKSISVADTLFQSLLQAAS